MGPAVFGVLAAATNGNRESLIDTQNLFSVTIDAAGHRTTSLFDLNGNVTQTTDPNAGCHTQME